MKPFRDYAIRHKLTLAFLAASITPLLTGVGLLLVYEQAGQRAQIVEYLTAQAEMIAVSTRASLDFNDPARATETLAVLRFRPMIVAASLYTPDGRIFARYVRPDAGTFDFPAPVPEGHRLSTDHLDLFRPVNNGGELVGTVFLRADLRLLGARFSRYVLIVGAGLSVLVAFSLGIAQFLQTYISRPLLALAGAAQQVQATQKYSIRAPASSNDEIGWLTGAFNRMLGGIEERDAALRTLNDHLGHEVAERQHAENETRQRALELEAANQELLNSATHARSLLEASLDPLVTISAAGKITDVNEGSIKATGVPRDQLIGTDFSDYFTEPERAREGYQQVFAQGFVTDYPLTIRHRDGRLTEVLYNASVYRDAQGKVLGVFAAARDVTKIRLAETQARQLNLQLTEANRELEAFAYSVSHDLRAPLRSIDGFSRILLDDYANRLEEDGRDSIARIRAAAQRMAQLIDDMLQLSRVTRAELNREKADLTEMARSVIADLQRLEPERRVEITITPGLVVEGDPHLLRIVLENLLGNAWKFTGRREQARIEFGAMKHDHVTHYFVRDNGAGFDPAYAGKLFGAFQRLHSSTDFPGTGVGLATVQRIIRRHGGSVRAEGGVEAGATFYFILGVPAPDNPARP